MTQSQTIETIEAAILERAAARGTVLGVTPRFEDPQVCRIVHRYACDIHVEPIDERIEMLTAAAIETLVLSRPAAELAGVYRALRDLDAGAALALAAMDRAIRDGAHDRHQWARFADAEKIAEGVAGRVFLDGSRHGWLLRAASFAAIHDDWQIRPLPAFLTPLGERVLETLRAWTTTATDAKAVA